MNLEPLLEQSLATAIFNQHLLGRAQVWADAARDQIAVISNPNHRSQLTDFRGGRLAAVVLETGFEPLPFEEAIAFFRNKTNLTPGQFAQLSEAARAKAFTIAGGATRQVRESIKDLLDEALSEGVTLPEFQRQADAVIDRAGLSPRTPWYWQTVYRTNMATSYQAGRWKQMTNPDVVAERPYLRYVSARLPTSRPSHVDKHGIVLPVGDPFWATWYPPNGFNCYCTVVSVSQSLLERRGWRVAEARDWLPPDEGFAVNPGQADQI